MKQQLTRVIAFSALALLVVSTALAQGKGGSNYPTTSNERGSDWETLTFGGKDYSYFKGNDKIDGYKTGERVMLGFHWKGNELSEVANDTLYLCNVATGEYMQVGEYWGETGMINHVGLAYKLIYGKSQRAQQPHVQKNGEQFFKNWEPDGYFLQPLGVREERVIGRMNRNDGKLGHFEYNKFLALRHMDEYDDGYKFNAKTGTFEGSPAPPDKAGLWYDAEHPGGFLFQFYPVTGDNGEQEYIIYTHRRTDILLNPGGRYDNMTSSPLEYRQRSEYKDRDSYLLLTNVGPMTADYNSVRFKKFAGEMWPSNMTPKTVTLGDQTDIVEDTDLAAYTNNNHKYGTYNMGSNYRGDTYTSNATSGEEGVTVKVDAPILGAAYWAGENYKHTMVFRPQDNDLHTITITAPYGFAITGYSISAVAYSNGSANRTFTVTPDGGTAQTVNANMVNISKSGLDCEKTTLTIQGADFGNKDFGLCFSKFTVEVKESPIGDEKESDRAVISLEDGLAAAAADKNNRWKLVTKTERDRFRLVASEDKPVDVSSRIVNPKFYTSFEYNWSKSQCSGNDTDGYTHSNGDTEFGWQWYNEDRTVHPASHHVHPFDMDYSGHETTKKEHHKVGTGHFWRTGTTGLNAESQEFMLTLGQEANYCGSIFKGTANIQQTIKGLREGLYVVYVRGFYAPHDMTKYTMEDWYNNSGDKVDGATVSSTAAAEWYNQACYTDSDTGEKLWHRSHDSYLFAWSYPNGKGGNAEPEEVRRMLPSIYEGAVLQEDLGKISRRSYIDSETFEYTQLGNWYKNRVNVAGQPLSAAALAQINNQISLMLDEHIFARYTPTLFNSTSSGSGKWVVPKTVTAAARFFNAVDETSGDANDTHKNASNYRIGLPVYVGSDGELTIGVDHTFVDGESNPDEWVCFDDFELLYMGKVEPDEFVIDEEDESRNIGPFEMIDGDTGEKIMESGSVKMSAATKMKNNTQWIDLFDPSDISNDGLESKKLKTVVLRRTMPKDGWSSVVLPVSLTLRHVKEMFGEKANVSKLDGFVGRTIMYKNQLEGKNDDDIVMKAGVPYIVRPSSYPIITKESGLAYERPAFTKAYSTSYQGVAGHYLKSAERNYQVERSLAGPIWVATDVWINSGESFPDIKYNSGTNTTYGDGTVWTAIKSFEKGNLEVEGKPELGKFKMVETGVYKGGGYIPAYSYYHANGKMYFTTGQLGPLPRGLYSYIQMVNAESNVVYSKPFIGGSDVFIEVVDEPTGIENINRPAPDGKMEIYDLQGRKVTKPGRGLYIVNGQKTLFM